MVGGPAGRGPGVGSGLELSLGVCGPLMGKTHTSAFANLPETSLLNGIMGAAIKVVFDEVKSH